MSLEESEGRVIDRSVDSTAVFKRLILDGWKVLIVVALAIGSGVFVYTSRGALLIAAMLIGGGLLALYFTYRRSRRRARTN